MNSPMRPTSDKVRAAVFSSISEAVGGCSFLDLFAGTGSVGIEAYSRGASSVTFIDLDTKTLEKNIELLPKNTYKLIKGDIFSIRFHTVYDIIFIDPPYGIYTPEKILNLIYEKNILAYNGIIIYEESVRTKFDMENIPFNMIKQRKYGDTMITYLENKNESNIPGNI